MNTKICIKCGAELDLSLFGKKQDSKDGLQGVCKNCRAEYKKEYAKKNKEKIAEHKKQYYQDNKEYIIEQAKQYCQDNKEHTAERQKQYRQDHKEHKKQYCQDNKEYIIEHKKQYRQDNKEHIAEYMKQYKKKHLDLGAIQEQKRRALKKLLPATLTTKQWITIKENWNLKCAYCGKELPLVMEHFIPLSKNGEFTIKNIIPSCQSCNSSKSSKNFLTWYPKHKYFSEERELKILDYLKEKEG